MTKSDWMKAYIESLGIDVLGDPIHESDADKYYVRIGVDRASVDGKSPSKIKILGISKYFESLGINAYFIINNEVQNDLEKGLRHLLLVGFDSIRNVFLQEENKRVDVWIEFKSASNEIFNDVSSRVKKFLEISGFELSSCRIISDENLPTKTNILKIIRLNAPASRKKIFEELLNKKFQIPSDDWLRRQLSSLEKAGNVVGCASDSITLTLTSLRSLGTEKYRHSPDIKRLLALAQPPK